MKSCAIADRLTPATLQRVSRLVASGVDIIQVRAKAASHEERLTFAREVIRIAAHSGTRVVINTDAALVARSGADGLHLPAGVPRTVDRHFRLLGRSCHSLDECLDAAREEFDYVFLGPVFPPRSKPGPGRVSMDDLRVAASMRPEVFALGGITADTLPQLAATGVAGIAAISLFFEDEAVESILERIRQL